MTLEELDSMFKKAFAYITESTQRRNLLLSTKQKLEEQEDDPGMEQEHVLKEEEDEESCDTQYEDNAESEEIYQKDVTYLIGAIINTHKDESLKYVPTIIETIIKPNMKGNANQQKITLFAADDLLDFLGYEKLGSELWKLLAEIVAGNVSNPEPMLRQAACYGMGCLAKMGGEAFHEIAVNCIRLLAGAVEVKDNKKKKALWAGAKEAAIAAIGKVLQYQGKAVPFEEVWSKWLEYLPLKEDESEAKEAHNFMVDYAFKAPEIAIGARGEHLKDVVRIFVNVYPTTLISKEAKEKIKAIVKQLGSNAKIASMLEEIYSKDLSAEDKKVLEEIYKS